LNPRGAVTLSFQKPDAADTDHGVGRYAHTAPAFLRRAPHGLVRRPTCQLPCGSSPPCPSRRWISLATQAAPPSSATTATGERLRARATAMGARGDAAGDAGRVRSVARRHRAPPV